MLVLFVDDDPDDFEVFSDAMKTVNSAAQCLHAINGQEALALLKNIKPDHIFLDINMPVMDGKECLKEIKASPSLKHIPVTIYSTTHNEHEVQALRKLGAKDFMLKPAVFHEIIRTLKAILQMR